MFSLALVIAYIGIWVASNGAGHHGQPTWPVMFGMLLGSATTDLVRLWIKHRA